MSSDIRPAIVSTVIFTALFGLAYPLAMTGAAKLAFPDQAEGSLLRNASGAVVGSSLIGQAFVEPKYLHPRPSAAGAGYDPTSSGGSNLGPLNPDLAKKAKAAADAVRLADGPGAVPDDAITASGSGLDPDISPAYAAFQVRRIAHARNVSPEAVRAVIARHTAEPALGFIGQPAVNVLAVNRALDERFPAPHP